MSPLSPRPWESDSEGSIEKTRDYVPPGGPSCIFVDGREREGRRSGGGVRFHWGAVVAVREGGPRPTIPGRYSGGADARAGEPSSFSLQHLARREVPQLGDLLEQRFKSLELGLAGNEAAASVVQLVGAHQGGLTNHQELSLAQK